MRQIAADFALPMKKTIYLFFLLCVALGGAVAYWLMQPILGADQKPLDFSISAGSGVYGAAQQIADAGAPLNPILFAALARASGKGNRLKAGSYELKPGATPLRLLQQLVRGEFAQESLTIIEGWSFKQMREAIAAHPWLKHDTANWSDRELLARVSKDFTAPEGLFFPDTYLFARGASDLQIYRQAFALMNKRLEQAWSKRAATLPYQTPYEALIMASIVEKETGQPSERGLVAGVFNNRLRSGMPLQTDPAVIYGMGERYQGVIHKKDLLADTPYNTYTRKGLPPTPIALPGAASLAAATNPDNTAALYFVARGDGTSYFSSNLSEHNQAVNKYQR